MIRECPQHDIVCYACGKRLYLCSRCKKCYACEHTSVYDNGTGIWTWFCRDNRKRPAICEDCGCGMHKQAQPILTWKFPTPIMPDCPVKF